jgi:pyridinium-3,5-biscarboxylic acid mononucleotide synthase
MNLREVLEKVREGSVSVEEAEQFFSTYGLAAVGHHRLDTHRARRVAVPEVVFGLGKSVEQLVEIISELARHGHPVLATKVHPDKAMMLLDTVAGVAGMEALRYEPASQTLRMGASSRPARGRVAVLTAGSSDAPVAEEAVATLDFFGVETVRHYDSGVAGLHRLFSAGDSISDADVVIVVAGMDGALPSVVGGLFRQPIIAVPTSVGYGASFDGLAALLTMMNACAPGVTVVNIDNGFGAAAAAMTILRAIARGVEVAATETNTKS